LSSQLFLVFGSNLAFAPKNKNQMHFSGSSYLSDNLNQTVCKIAIKNLAILQTGDLAAILRYRRIFSPHRIGEHTARRKNGLCLV
jgi:hypothetical protein